MATQSVVNEQFQPESIELYFQEGKSDKVYHVQLDQTESGWHVCAQWGRRNSTLSTSVKGKDLAYEKAKKLYDNIVNAKLAEHYKIQATSAAVTPLTNSRGLSASRESVFAPELLTRITEEEAKRFASDPRYFFQTKHDGDRLTVHAKSAADIFGYNKKGQVVPLNINLERAIRNLAEPIDIFPLLLDGEWEPTGYYVWDLLESRYNLRDQEYRNRLSILETIFKDADGFLLHITNTARTTEQKLAMLSDRKLEGVCVKDTRAIYQPGRNGQHKKFKFEQTGSFIVGPKPPSKANDGHRSVALYLCDPECNEHAGWLKVPTVFPNRIRYVSTVGVCEKDELPPIGAVIEVRYLYAYPQGGVAQPHYFGKQRTDVNIEECSTAQLKYKLGSE